MNCDLRGRIDAARVSAKRQRGFTLVELLVVIAIIGILAGLLIPLAGIATTKMRIARVKAELNAYVNAIETYKLETGEYPPDNGGLQGVNTNTDMTEYKLRLARNPLYYELTGATFANPPPRYTNQMDKQVVMADDLNNVFAVNGLRNSARLKNDLDYKGFTLKQAQTAVLHPSNGAPNLRILAVPVPGPFTIGGANNAKINPWFYDASSTNRHNKNTFDLWAEIEVGGKTQVIGNWKN